jgi:hypothetical protein
LKFQAKLPQQIRPARRGRGQNEHRRIHGSLSRPKI